MFGDEHPARQGEQDVILVCNPFVMGGLEGVNCQADSEAERAE